MGSWHIMRKTRFINDNNGFLVFFYSVLCDFGRKYAPRFGWLSVFIAGFSSLESMAYASCRHRSSPLMIHIRMFFPISLQRFNINLCRWFSSRLFFPFSKVAVDSSQTLCRSLYKEARSSLTLSVKIFDVQSFVLDKEFAWLHIITHQIGKNLTGVFSIFYSHLQKGSCIGIQGCFP